MSMGLVATEGAVPRRIHVRVVGAVDPRPAVHKVVMAFGVQVLDLLQDLLLHRRLAPHQLHLQRPSQCRRPHAQRMRVKTMVGRTLRALHAIRSVMAIVAVNVLRPLVVWATLGLRVRVSVG